MISSLLHAVFVGGDHLFDHLTADAAGLTGRQITVVALLEVYAAASILKRFIASRALGLTRLLLLEVAISFSISFSCFGFLDPLLFFAEHAEVCGAAICNFCKLFFLDSAFGDRFIGHMMLYIRDRKRFCYARG